jgi:hypothetical protein
VLWIGVIAMAALVLVFWDRPTGKVIIGITLAVLVALVIIEFRGRPPSPVAPEEVSPGVVPPAPDAPEAESSAGVDVGDASPTASVELTSSQAHDTPETEVRG